MAGGDLFLATDADSWTCAGQHGGVDGCSGWGSGSRLDTTLPGDGVHQLYMNMPRSGPSGFMREASEHGSVYAMLMTYVAFLPWPSKSWAAAGLAILTSLG